ncbi:MAG: F0F1 ATP synthase subunit C [Deltaproteobacteria bacterium]|nr:F0F1 ATP synthase subunit C [Deltaproteobacteria bacterium]
MKRLGMVVTSMIAVLWSATAFAQENTAIARPGDGGWMALAIGFALGVAALGGGLGQGKTAAAAVEGLARNPSVGGRLIVPMILGLAFIESLYLFTWVGVLFIMNRL